MIRALRLLREEYRFNGYIHAKAIPGTAPELVEQLGFLADRLSVNIELPSEAGLRTLAPDKTKGAILAPMRQIQVRGQQSREELVKYRHAPRFAPAGQSTQLIVGATPDTDFHILRLTQGLYDRYQLKRVFYSAYVPVVEHALLPGQGQRSRPCCGSTGCIRRTGCCGFTASGPRSCWMQAHPDFNPQVDPKCSWALPAPGLLPGGGQHGRTTRPCCGSPAWAWSPPSAFSSVPPDPEAADRGSAPSWGW